MLVAFWIISGLIALAFLGAGLMKLARPKEALASSGMGWTEDFTTGPVKLIGAAEVVGAIGLALPPLLGVATILSPIAAIALAVLMIGAVVIHLRRSEPFIAPLVLALLSIVSAILGFIAIV
ncbi:DoxX family protein [Curtobacterium flaccumfaciens pv. beticola]|uniref:DoxX family protein n=1 Tax=Curtobacterium flaccumfaciens TaxID=2035 RepID=UPI00349FB4AA|nr:DoxX family protein [Curtobacterium flaccumfaciens pv. basellae]